MRKFVLFLVNVMFIAAIACNSPKSDEAKITEEKSVTEDGGVAYAVDPSASTLKFIGTKVSGYHIGQINFKSGKVMVKKGEVTGGEIVFDQQSMAVVGPKGSDSKSNMKLQGHLRSGEFFDVEKYPEAKFVITKVTPVTGAVTEADDPRQEELSEYKVTNPTHTVSGNLTIRDVTKNVEFPARITVNGNDVETVAKFNIDRREWGITYPGAPDDLIRDDVHIGLTVKAHRQPS